MILHNVCVANNFYRDTIFRDLLQCGVDKTNKINRTNRTNSISIAAQRWNLSIPSVPAGV